jgi:GTP-binding protein EngB required for normal cell division
VAATAASPDGTLLPPFDALDGLASIAHDLGVVTAAEEATATLRRLEEQRFFVACVGQFKRGKSTVINALVGQPVLPVGVAPVTSVVTILRHGEVAAARAVSLGGQVRAVGLQDIAAYVDERRNPGNRLGIAAAEVFLPSPLLAGGLCLVDTPGVGSVFTANTDATRAFLPQIDAALVVLGADPPVSKVELDLIVELASQVGDIVVVLNKADRLSAHDVGEAVSFTEEVLGDSIGSLASPVFQVSASERLGLGRATRDWATLEERLRALTAGSRDRLLAEARRRTVGRVSQRLLAEIAERDLALRRPIGETEARVARLRDVLGAADRSLADLSYLLIAAEADLARSFEKRREAFEQEALGTARARLDAWVATHVRTVPTGRLRRVAYDEARALALRTIEAWLPDVEPAAEALYGGATRRFVALANDFLVRMTADAPAPGEAVRDHPMVAAGFQQRRRFYFTSLMSLTGIGPATWLLDRLSPPAWRERRVGKAAWGYCAHLLRTNAMRVENDLRERVLESRRHLEREVRACLTDVASAGQRALEEARQQVAQGSAALEGRLAHLAALRAQVQALAGGLDARGNRRASPPPAVEASTAGPPARTGAGGPPASPVGQA